MKLPWFLAGKDRGIYDSRNKFNNILALLYSMDIQKITIIKIRKPLKNDINEELQWLGTSLGLFSLRDRDKSCFRIFIELLKSTKKQRGLSSDEIAYRLKISRGTVIHHIKKLKSSGLVVLDNKKYLLRVDNLSLLVDEVKSDIERAYDDLKDVAKDIDLKLGL
jgi:biotin operon repressor